MRPGTTALSPGAMLRRRGLLLARPRVRLCRQLLRLEVEHRTRHRRCLADLPYRGFGTGKPQKMIPRAGFIKSGETEKHLIRGVL